ncbi:MAG: hypothetical protein IJW36_02820 [Clostridia bacterium]|nr:hypothetical protein [Clostridia bacterium]
MRAVSEKLIFKSNQDVDYLFEQGVRECLNENVNVDEILRKFIHAFINENNIDSLECGSLKHFSKKDDGPIVWNSIACSMGNGVYFKSSIFKRKDLFNSLRILFHELEHCNTYFKNNDNSVFRGEQVLTYAGIDKPYSSYCLYITSDNEHNSRLAEITYIEKFINVLENLLNRKPDLQTTHTKKIVKSLKHKLQRLTTRISNRYERNLKKKNSPRTVKKVKSLAVEALNLYKNCDKKIEPDDELRYFAYITDYLTAYKDESFAIEVLDYIKSSHDSFLRKNVHHIFNSGAIKADKANIDRLIFKYSCFGNEFLDLIDGEDLAKHNLLFHGKAIVNSATGRQMEEMREFIESVKDYKFNGIAIRFENYIYSFEINGQVFEFTNANDAFVTICNHINISMLDDLNPENLKEINSLLGEKVTTRVKTTAKKSVSKRKARIQVEDKNLDVETQDQEYILNV